ncbi:MAG: hypothetical protein KGZ71_04240 [Desulfobulbaceae bacterium]|nr:hypothetical protein [Desulfobulbaceae bacterium]
MSAQLILNSTIREEAEIWTPLVEPVLIGNGDFPWRQIPMPFTFQYDGTNVSNLWVYGDGYLRINAAQATLPNFPQTTNIISWYKRDLFTEGMLSYKVTGATPFRVLTIEHRGFRIVTDFSGAIMDAQIKFYETTNEVKIIYNRVSGFGGTGQDGFLYFEGAGTTRYINIKPNAPNLPSTFYYGNSNQNVNAWLTKDAIKYFYSGRSFTLTSLPRISGIYPDQNAVLANGKVYSGEQHPFVRVSRSAEQKAITIRYSITGPLGTAEEKVIYTAVNENDASSSESIVPNPQPVGTGIRYFMPHAKGIAGRLSDGALDMTAISELPSGEYRVTAILEYLDGTPYNHTVSSVFTVAFPSDLAILDVLEPINTPGSIYQLFGSGVPIRIKVKNQGADNINKFTAIAYIYDVNGNLVGQPIVKPFELGNNPIKYLEVRELAMDAFFPQSVGKYSIRVRVNFDNLDLDKFMSNNVYPRDGDPSKPFEVGYAIEADAMQLLSPFGQTYVMRPIRLSARLKNNGVSDVSDTWASIMIKNPSGEVVFIDTVPVGNIPSGFVNTLDIFWPTSFIPQVIGTYTGEFYIHAPGDEVPSNNLRQISFNVTAGLRGTYTISQAAGSNFKTISDAVNAMYQQGVSGPVTFWLNDENYYEGNLLMDDPALDLSSTIIGLSAENPVTFTVNPLESSRGAVTINLSSASGIGVFIAQNIIPSNVNAPIVGVTQSLVNKYANPSGYITFDGGVKKSLRFTLNTPSQFRAVFYLGQGAHNITIKNCLIEDGINQTPSYLCRIPLTTYNSFLSKFTYEADRSTLGTYSAGIVVRNVPPMDKNLGTNPFNLDTVSIKNIKIHNNEITRFGYGIVSLGIGPLQIAGRFIYSPYYNLNNSYTNNTISSVSRAGIFLGFEKNTEIFGNRIYNINGACAVNAAGIIAGGDGTPTLFPYHNIGLEISGNEISNIKATGTAYGIKVEQSRLDFFDLDDDFSFPNEDENILIVNNMVWGFEPISPATNVIGLGLFTQRTTNVVDWTGLNLTPKFANYYSRNDLITNNTIFMNDDGFTNTGALAAIAVMNTKGMVLMNNAIGIDDSQVSSESPFTTALFYYGLHPKKGGMTSDRNAYWIDSPKGSIIRFIETDETNRILEFGHKTEFTSLSQWQQWTGEDFYSVVGNFTLDYKRFGLAPYMMRIQDNPIPRGSILNNRGTNLEVNARDIDGKFRGMAGERYDIGAVEFDGRIFGKDLEVTSIVAPGRYKATPPLPFSESEYIMTTSPVGVQAIVRSNGLLPVGASSVVLKIFRESPSGSYIQEGADIVAPIDKLLFSEDLLIDFRTNDGINTADNPEFFPSTYGQLRGSGYVIPDQFKAMEANVTPLYKIMVTFPSDEFNANNGIEKLVRFYIKKSPIELMVSAENIQNIDSESPIDRIAGNLNLDSIMTAFFRLGWYINLELEDPRIDVDVFDRRAWEPRSIDYTIYRTLVWVDAHDQIDGATYRLTRYDRDNIENYLNSGTFNSKKNLLIGSQELVRNESIDMATWVRTNFNAKVGVPNNPLGSGASYDGKFVNGVILGRDLKFKVISTQFFGDDAPRAGLFTIDNAGVGISRIGMKYASHINDVPANNFYVADGQRVAVIATTAVKYNTILAGLDWRHWADLSSVLRGMFDFIEMQGGNIIPVELYDFVAVPSGKRVDISWKTASEIESDKFEIEKSEFSEAGRSFNIIESVKAIGQSSVSSQYGPFIDNNVQYGKTYVYRLKMIDRDGKFTYSDEKFVEIQGTYGAVELNSIQPNPVSTSADVSYNVSESMNISLVVYDALGNEVQTLFNGFQNAGEHKVNVNVANMANGSYNIVLKGGNDIYLTTKLTVVK